MALTNQRVGRKPLVLEARPLSRADLARLPEKRENNGIAQQLRSHHHRVARLVAFGLKDYEVCEICNISQMRLYTLKKTPAFDELVSLYRREQRDPEIENASEFTRLLVSNRFKAEHLVADKLDAAIDGEIEMSTRDLLAISRDAADRTGYPKGSVQTVVSVSGQLEKALARQGRTITVDAKGSSPALASKGTESMASPSSVSPSPTSRALVSRRGF